MATLTFKGSTINTLGEFPKVGTQVPNFKLIKSDLTELSLTDLKGKRVIFNIFPSVDTPVCALQLKRFSQEVSQLDNTLLVFVSLDLPFAFSRFCGAEGIENAITASDFRSKDLAESYGVLMQGGPLDGLYARGVLVFDETQKVIYSELVNEVTDEPNYVEAVSSLK